MPAYRSEAEAEIRDAVIARLRVYRPDARIMHEINAAGQGSNRIDVLAVDRSEIIAVEIKSEKDKLDRLPDQIKAMRGVAHHVIAALHEKFLVAAEYTVRSKNPRTGFYDQNGTMTYFSAPAEGDGAKVWAYPEKTRDEVGLYNIWREPELRPTTVLPPAALGLLWADELRDLCRFAGVSVPPRANMDQAIAALRWGATGAQITKGICAALRARNCIEADPPIVGDHTTKQEARNG